MQLPMYPVLLVLGSTAALGLWMGWNYLKGVRNSAMVAGIHLLLGVSGLEVLAILLSGAPDGSRAATSTLGPVAAVMLGGAMMTGLFVPIIAKPKPAAIGPTLRDKGQVFVGIDVIGDWLTEINVTSPTGIQELERFDGTNAAERIWQVIEAKRGL